MQRGNARGITPELIQGHDQRRVVLGMVSALKSFISPQVAFPVLLCVVLIGLFLSNKRQVTRHVQEPITWEARPLSVP